MTKLLVIDDDPELAELLCHHLAARGFAATRAHDGGQGIDAVRRQTPDIVLLDFMLPDMDGLQVLDRIKSESPGTEVVLITGRSDVKIAVEALRNGAFDYLQKPFELDELDRCVERALRQAEMERRLAEHVKSLEEANKRLQEAQSQLIQAEKMSALGQLAAGVAHEINNPLTAVCMNVAFLLREVQEEKQLRRLRIIEKEADRAAAIVKTLLTFSRKSAGDKRERASLQRVIDEIVRPLEGQLAVRNIALAREYAADAPEALLDVNRMQQVFLNLVNNACEAMPRGGTLSIRTSHARGSEETVVEFSDTGEGIRAEDLDRIFTPFFTTKPPGKGVGLGLYICRSIVLSHGGDIEAESSEGQGATFRIRLPAAP